MLLKLFGREIFQHNTGETLISNARNNIKEDKFLPDFYIKNQFNDLLNVEATSYLQYASANNSITSSSSGSINNITIIKKEDKKKEKHKRELKPKTIFKLKLLHEKDFCIKVDSEYVDKQLEILKNKLSLIQSSKYDMGNGVQEIASMVIRMENRKQYPKFEKFYSQFAYTTTIKIKKVLTSHNYLKMDKVEQFLADMPEDAIKAMAEYKTKTLSLCNKLPLFYIIANKKDFQKTDTRKDPILLAQSPFGHFWSILGAWDEEMILLDEL